MSRPQVVCVGAVTLDALALVDRYPRADQRVEAETVVFAGGGPAATAAVVLARQGIHVAFVGRVGADTAGEQATADLEREGVDVSGMLIDPSTPTQTSCVVVARRSHSRAIATRSVPPLSTLADAGLDAIGAAEWVLADHLGFAPVAAHLRPGKQRPRLALDAGNPVHGLQLSLIDLYIPTVSTLCSTMTPTTADPDQAATSLLADGVGSVVATDGSRGSYAWWSDGSRTADAEVPQRAYVPAFSDVEIVSTLGAGDVFHGALMAALCRGENWPQALQSANATAALSCRALDGRSAIPGTRELEEFLHGRPGR